jgi:hypothetical protein
MKAEEIIAIKPQKSAHLVPNAIEIQLKSGKKVLFFIFIIANYKSTSLNRFYIETKLMI